jgi:hypothetical protein
MYENTIYDVSIDKSFNVNSTDLNFWLTFLKENSEQSYKNLILKYNDIQKIIRETVYNVSNFFSDREKDKFLIEFETKFSNNLIMENQDTESNLSNISNSWDFIIDKINILKEEESWFDSAVSGIKSAGKYVYDKVSSGFKYLKEKGIDWFFEQIRAALQSWGGAAVQAFLATFGAAIGGNIILVIVWGVMLAYDIYKGINGDWVWSNILIDLIGVITTGPGAKILGELFKKLGILGTKLPLGEIIKRISTSRLGSWFVKMLQKLMSGVSTITGWITKGVNWLATKLGIKGLTKATSNITSRVSSIVDEISAATSKVIKPKVTQLKQAVKPKVTQLKQGLQTVGSGLKKGLTSKSGQVATAAGLTYGINKATGGSTEALGGAFVDKEGQITDLLVSNNSGWDVNDLP